MEETIPTTWAELLARIEGNKDKLDAVPGVFLNRVPSRESDVPTQLGAVAMSLTQLALAAGPEAAASWVGKWKDRFLTAVRVTDRQLDPVNVYCTTSFANLAACVGALPPEAEGIEQRWLPAAVANEGMFSEEHRYTMAMASAATGQDALVPTWLHGKPSPEPPRAGETFGLASGSVALYLSEAAVVGLSEQAVTPAWETFLDAFPLQLAAKFVTWTQLLLMARIRRARIGRAPVAEVARWLHGEVRRA